MQSWRVFFIIIRYIPTYIPMLISETFFQILRKKSEALGKMISSGKKKINIIFDVTRDRGGMTIMILQNKIGTSVKGKEGWKWYPRNWWSEEGGREFRMMLLWKLSDVDCKTWMAENREKSEAKYEYYFFLLSSTLLLSSLCISLSLSNHLCFVKVFFYLSLSYLFYSYLPRYLGIVEIPYWLIQGATNINQLTAC